MSCTKIIPILLFFIVFHPAWSISHNFGHLTIKDGLSQSTIKSIHQDYKGFVWIGSADGLNKYDAYQFTIYRNNPISPQTLCGNDIACIYEDPKDSSLWIGNQTDGLNYYVRDNDTFIRYRNGKKGSIPSNNITAILREEGGKLWISTKDKGLCCFNESDSTFAQPAFALDERLQNINAFVFDPSGRLWIGTTSGLFVVEPLKKNDFSRSIPQSIDRAVLPSASIGTLLFDRRGNLWIGTQKNGLLRYNHENKTITEYNQREYFGQSTPPMEINCLVQQKNGEIWIGSGQGLYQYLPADNHFSRFANDPLDSGSLNDEVIFSMFEDHSGILWLGTCYGGINKLDPDESRFNRYGNFHKLFGLNRAANNVKSICTDHQDMIWICTNKGLLAFDRQTINNRQADQNNVKIFFKETDQYLIFEDSKSTLYLSNQKGIFIRERNQQEFSPFRPRVSAGTSMITSITYAFEDSDKTIWLLSSQGLFRYTPADNRLEMAHPIGELLLSANDYFMTGIESMDGRLWLGTANGKLFQYNKNTNQIKEIKPTNLNSETKPYNRIFSICEQTSGTIWYGTNNGLYQYSEANNTVRSYMDSDGLANNVVYATLTDKKNRIWCSTNYGISVLTPANNAFTNYTWEDGLQSNEFNQSAYFKSNDGTIYMGGIEGFNIIEPERITPNAFVPPVAFTALSVYHEPVTPFSHPKVTTHHISQTNALTLTYRQAIFTLEFAALNYIHANKNQYRYMLKGYDKEWINGGTGRKATYTNISSGEYTFMVQGSNNNGIWNTEAASIRITILPPYWLTWWFKLLFFLLLASGSYLIFSFRLRTIKRKASLLKQLVQEKTADLSEKNKHIETQNHELIRINEEINLRNQKIEEKNIQLNHQNEQIAEQRDNLIHLSDELKRANQAKINFFTNISHEFRTPLTLIIGPLKELTHTMDNTSAAELQRKFKIVYGNASKLLMLVNQLLDFRKADTDNITLRYSKLDIVNFTRQTASLFNDMAKRKKIEFGFHSSFSHRELCFDQDKMEKIIFNLLSNAFKFTPANGEINITLDIKPSEAGPNLLLSVSDTGQGIAIEDQQIIFEPFFQSNRHDRQQEAGSGIGLALVKKYTELHNGSIHLNSSPGNGSTFVMKIPMVEQCNEAGNQLLAPANSSTIDKELLFSSMEDYSPLMLREQKTGKEYQLPKILLVEDDNDLRAYLREILSPAYRIIESQLAAPALELVEKQNPDLILSDVMLPDFNGFELCVQIKNTLQTSHVPVVLLTALSDLPNELKGIKSGADAYLSKPFDVQHLLATIENLIVQRRKLKEKFYRGISIDSAEYTSNQGDQAFLTKVMAEIEKNITHSDFDVEALCQSIHLSQPQTYRKIKALTNLSITEFIRNIRLKKAAQLLATGNQSISEVAYEVGFSDPNYFTKCFVKLYGQTPSDFVKLKN